MTAKLVPEHAEGTEYGLPLENKLVTQAVHEHTRTPARAHKLFTTEILHSEFMEFKQCSPPQHDYQ